jgi:hypothetical protein
MFATNASIGNLIGENRESDCESAYDLTPNRLVTLVGCPINSSIQCVAVRGLGSDLGSDSHLMNFSAGLAVLQRGNQRHASRYSNFVASAEWVGYRERK